MKNRAKPGRAKRRPAGRAARRRVSSPDRKHPFVIVGIGASAGGLEALALFLANVPAGSRIAFVVVQHLDPTLKGMLPELLQRATTMRVFQVKDGVEVRPGCVYVIPPNKDLSILRGRLHLLRPAAPRGLRLPIDLFFRSLAADQHELAVGIILSGMGSDGTLGLRAIKENSGLVLVQDPASAKYASMPRSALETGLTDLAAPAEELPARLVDCLRRLPLAGEPGLPLEEKVVSALDKVIIVLRSGTGQDFSHYRQSTLYRRVERRMGVHKILRISTYVRFLQENPQELAILFKELLIGVTSFFRDRAAWDQIEKKALPPLLADRPSGTVLRAWVAGCSTGEEAYTLAILMAEALKRGKTRKDFTLQIYATDLDRDAINKARLGVYPMNIAADVSPGRLSRYFVKEDNGYRVGKEIRAMVVFAQQNLIMDPPFTKLDIFCCRNLLIYLLPEMQKKLMPLFHFILNPGGLLFLGGSESVGRFGNLFTTISGRERIFRRREHLGQGEPLQFPGGFAPAPGSGLRVSAAVVRPAESLQSLADQVLQARFSPPAALVNERGDIVYISGKTGKYLEPAVGKANWNINAMAREGLRYELSNALQKASRKKGPVTVQGIKVGTGAEADLVDITVQTLEEPKELLGLVLVVFNDAAPPPEPRAVEKRDGSGVSTARHGDLQRELRHARDEAKTNREEMQTSQEELKSMNEELQSTNEELQSTNEELTTSKEETQSLNEELQTVNAELQSKLDELSSSNNDMKNLLNSTDIATLFLDNAMCVRRFTLQAKAIFKLIPGDLGRPITDLSSTLLYPELVTDAKDVLRTLAPSEKAVSTLDGSWFTARILPYNALDNRIDGVVITFTNITAAKKLEANLREKHSRLEDLTGRQALKAARGGTRPPIAPAAPARAGGPDPAARPGKA